MFSDDIEEVYSARDFVFSGCAMQYSVFRAEEEPDCIRNDPDRANPISVATKDSIIRCIASLNVPERFYPDFEQEYTYTVGKELTYVIYFPETHMLRVIVIGH